MHGWFVDIITSSITVMVVVMVVMWMSRALLEFLQNAINVMS
jgi:hypothetical protein